MFLPSQLSVTSRALATFWGKSGGGQSTLMTFRGPTGQRHNRARSASPTKNSSGSRWLLARYAVSWDRTSRQNANFSSDRGPSPKAQILNALRFLCFLLFKFSLFLAPISQQASVLGTLTRGRSSQTPD